MSSSSRLKIGVLVLAAVLLAPWSAFAEPGARLAHPGTTSWVLLARLWSAVAAFWGDNGCSVDPFGVCGAASTPPEPSQNVDNGCGMDPYGSCREGSAPPEPSQNADAGCSMDPYGGCRAGS